MLSIIIGIVIIAVLIFVGIEIKINDTIFSVIFVGVILSSLVIGLFYPAKGFTDWQLVKETELDMCLEFLKTRFREKLLWNNAIKPENLWFLLIINFSGFFI